MRLQLVACAAALLACGLNRTHGGDAAALAEQIDRHIQTRLDAEKLQRAAPADDGELVRRLYLDLHGIVPTAEQAGRFIDNGDSHKRARLIDELLANPRFGEHMADLWRGRLISPLASEQRLQTDRFAAWLAERFNKSDGWNKIVFDLLTATGKIDENPAVTYLIEGRNPLSVTDLADLSSRYFLGVRLNCAQCHDHPFVAWKRDDYWGMAAFFSQIQTPGRPKQVYMAGLRDDPKMTLATLAEKDMIEGFQLRPPTFLGGQSPSLDGGNPHRVVLARWVTSADNPYFARAAVNRLWWHFFGRGIVDPVDDMHEANLPSHPELLELLSREFAASEFDIKFLCRAILNSRTYQQTSRSIRDADREAELIARMSIKVLSAEQLYDSLLQILGPPAKTPGIDVRLGARHEFTQFFAGDSDAEPTRYERGIPHLLRLMNSAQFNGRGLASLVSRIMPASHSPDELVDALFLSILARRPTGADRQVVQKYLAAGDAAQDAYRELAWALLLSSEFSLNH
jgi:hypothetical protein